MNSRMEWQRQYKMGQSGTKKPQKGRNAAGRKRIAQLDQQQQKANKDQRKKQQQEQHENAQGERAGGRTYVAENESERTAGNKEQQKTNGWKTQEISNGASSQNQKYDLSRQTEKNIMEYQKQQTERTILAHRRTAGKEGKYTKSGTDNRRRQKAKNIITRNWRCKFHHKMKTKSNQPKAKQASSSEEMWTIRQLVEKK